MTEIKADPIILRILETLLELKDEMHYVISVLDNDLSQGDELEPIDEDDDDTPVPVSDQKNCYFENEDEHGTVICCPLPHLEDKMFCENHQKEQDDFVTEIEMYLKDYLKTVNDDDRTKIATYGLGWKKGLLEDLNMSTYRFKKLATDGKKAGKTEREIAIAIESGEY